MTAQPHPAGGAAYQGLRALVLGGSGFIGRWVAARLTEMQATAMVAVRDPVAFSQIAGQWGIRAEVHAFDAMNAPSVTSVLERAVPDIVFNLIGYGVDRSETKTELMWRINRDVVSEIARSAAHLSRGRFMSGGIRLVHVGSALEYGPIEGIASEASETRPHTEYGRSKLAGTNALREVASQTGLAAVTARVFTVFGPGEHEGRLLPAIRRAVGEGTVVRLSSGLQRRDFGYVEDVAEGLLRLGVSVGPPGEVVNVATGTMTSVRTFAETAARLSGLPDNQLLFGAEPVRDDEMVIAGVDVSRLQDRTGWSLPAGLEASLRRAAAFEDRLSRRC
jgi:nucleoside-diphosphate-sugar epimerase